MELVHIDYVGMEVTVATQEKPVIKNVLVVVDHFTWYVQAFVTWNQTARTTTRVLYTSISRYLVSRNDLCLIKEPGLPAK